MPNWKKLIVSGSDASLNSLNVTNNVTAQSFTGSFSGSFTAPGATTQVVYNNGGVLAANSGFVYSGSNVGIGVASPGVRLDVSGDIRASNVLYGSSTFVNLIRMNGGTELPFRNSSNVEVMRITSGGNVGIGTTSPATQLTLSKAAGNAMLQLVNADESAFSLKTYNSGSGTTRGRAFVQYLDYSSTVNGYMAYHRGGGGSDGFLSFGDNGGERVRFANGGNVGIGTTSPGAKLHVGGGEIRVDAGQAVTLDTSNSMYLVGASNQLRLYNGGNPVVNITTGGNVGIGTTSPSEKLSLAGSTATTFGLSLEPSGWNSAKHRLTVPTSGDVSMWSFNWNGSAVDSALYAPASILLAQGTITFNTTGSANSPAARMIINTVGNVGIGTSSPSYRLDVSGSFRVDGTNGDFIVDSTGNDIYLTRNGASYFIANQASSTISFLMGAGVSQSLFLANNGSVAIGATSTSGYKLYVAGDTWIGGTTNYIDGTTVLRTAGANEVMRIASSGNVGIGTSSPSTLLQVAGDITFGSGTGTEQIYTSNGAIVSYNNSTQNFTFGDPTVPFIVGNRLLQTIEIKGDSTNTDIFIDGNNRFVGIGTTSPTSKLDVRGTLTVSGSGANVDIKSSTTTSTLNIYGSDTSTNFLGVGILSDNVTRWRAGMVSGRKYQIAYADGGGSFTPTAAMTIVSGSGNVGIGNTSPGYKLDVSGVGNFTNIGSQLLLNGGFGAYDFATSTGNDFSISLSGTAERMRITSAGNVGIGTSSPSQKLSVVGAVSASTYYGDGSNLTNIGSGSVSAAGSDGQLQYNNSGLFGGASRLYYNDSTNRVGIGTSSPGYDLDVSGSVRVQDRLRVGIVNTGNGVIHQSSDATVNPTSATVVWTVSGTAGICAFIEYYLINNNTGTSQRAGNVVVTWNQAGTPTITHTETSTPDIGSTGPVTLSTALTLGGDPQLIATNSGGDSWYMIMNYRYF